ncbi:exosortase/archaeosortase family protein [Candidatus Hodarchaeum mangrovi]
MKKSYILILMSAFSLLFETQEILIKFIIFILELSFWNKLLKIKNKQVTQTILMIGVLFIVIIHFFTIIRDDWFITLMINISVNGTILIYRYGMEIISIGLIVTLGVIISRISHQSFTRNLPVMFCLVSGMLSLTILLGQIFNFSLNRLNSGVLEIKVHNEVINFEIIESCSGIQSLTIFIICFLIFTLITRQKWDLEAFPVLTLGLIGCIGVIFLNAIRITILIWISSIMGEEAISTIHLVLGAVLLLIYLTSFWSSIWNYLLKNSNENMKILS